MCEELKLIQTHLGIWKLEDWPVNIAVVQISNRYGIYCLKNCVNGKLLIGQGKIGGSFNRPWAHLLGQSLNRKWKKDLKEYGKENFRLSWIIEENDEIKRCLIENKLQIYFKDNCYNRPRVSYPTQKDLLEDIDSSLNRYGTGNISERINRYNIVGDCWESLYHVNKNNLYPTVLFKGNNYKCHILMYILHYGDICGISSVIHHKCENKRCVNPEHLELTTHIGNIHDYFKPTAKTQIKNSTEYRGISYHKNNKFYEARFMKGKSVYLGFYDTAIKAAYNRDYYIVKNQMMGEKYSALNFHDIDYNNFEPYKMKNGKLNNNLQESFYGLLTNELTMV